MIEWLKGLNIEDRVSFLPLLAICFLLLVLPYFEGGNGYQAESFLFILTGPIVYFAWRSDPQRFAKMLVNPISIIFFLVVVTMAFSLIPSTDKVTSFVNVLHWVSFYVIFVSAGTLTYSSNRFQFMSGVVILSALIYSAMGVWQVLTSANFHYLRATSVFIEHNTFGGFLILPVALLFGRYFAAKSKEAVVLWGAALVTGLSAFIFTFSRGSWLSLIVGVIAAVGIYRSHIFAVLHNRTIILRIVSISVITIAAIAGIYQIVSRTALHSEETVYIFPGETLERNAFTARLNYFRDATTVILDNPLLGVGLQHYGEAVKLYKDTPAYYASSPHNEYLKLMAEVGVVGGLLFLALIVLLVARVITNMRRTGLGWIHESAFVAGALGILLYLMMEIGWGSVVNPLFFFVLMGSCMGITPFSTAIFASGMRIRVFTLFLSLSIVCIAGLVSLTGVLYWYQSYHLELGLIYSVERDFKAAEAAFVEAQRVGDIDFNPHYFLALMFEHLGVSATTTAEKEGFYRRGLFEISEAIKRKPEKPLFYSWQARLYNHLHDDVGAQQALEMCVKYNPIDGVYEYEALATLYNEKKHFEKTVAIANTVLHYYPLEMYHDPYWTNPERDSVWRSLVAIYNEQSKAYAKLGLPDEARTARADAERYLSVLPKQEISTP